MKSQALGAVAVAVLVGSTLGAQAQKGPATSELEATLYRAADVLGMLRSAQEVDRISSVNYWGTGTATVDGQPCTIQEYKGSVNYLHEGMRVDVTCSGPTPRRVIQVVNKQLAWNEKEPGVGATPAAGTAAERQLQIWTLPHGAVKAARAAGNETKVGKEGGAITLSFPIPAAKATATATLNERYLIDRIVTRQGDAVTETTYAEYGDWNGADYLSDVLFPKRITQRRGGVTLLDLTVSKTNTYNPYVIMPVPANVR
jgi:hypothetical protein